MAQGLVTHAILEDIADAIREKTGSQSTYTPAQMADAVELIGWEMPTEHSWANASDSDIVGIIKASHAGLIDLQQDAGWAVGDVRRITLTTNEEVDLVIPTFAEYEGCGNVLQFDFKDCTATEYKMKNAYYDWEKTGVWTDTDMYKSYIPAIVNTLPSYIKDNLIPFNVRVMKNAGSDHSIIIVPNNLMSLRSCNEVASDSYGEGTPIPYYKDDRTHNIKKKGVNGSTISYWLRSPDWGTYKSFNYITESGYCNQGGGNTYSRPVAPFGCL